MDKYGSGGLKVLLEDMPSATGRLGDASALRGRTVLITGAAGFLASHMVDALAYLIDADSPLAPARLVLMVRRLPEPGSRLGHLRGRADVDFVVQDACSPPTFREPVHFIVHAASPSSPAQFMRDPVAVADANSTALRHLLELGRCKEVQSVLYLSSSEVYGNPETHEVPTAEGYPGRVDFTSARAVYAESKRFGEALCYAYYRQHDVPVRVVRPFHIYGPGMREDDPRLVPDMMYRGVTGRPFELLTDGGARRTYAYVADATAGLLAALLSEHVGESFNLGADRPEVTALDVTRRIASLFGATPNDVHSGTSQDVHVAGPPRVKPDLEKAQRLLGYSATIGLDEGLERTAHWYRAEYGERKSAP